MMPLGSVLDCGTWFSLIEEQLYYLSSYGRRLAVSRRRARSVLAGGGRMVDGEPYAGGAGEPGVVDGDLPASARSRPHHAYRPWQPVWRGELSAAPHPAWGTAQYESEGQLLGQRGGRELLSHPKNRIDLSGGF